MKKICIILAPIVFLTQTFLFSLKIENYDICIIENVYPDRKCCTPFCQAPVHCYCAASCGPGYWDCGPCIQACEPIIPYLYLVDVIGHTNCRSWVSGDTWFCTVDRKYISTCNVNVKNYWKLSADVCKASYQAAYWGMKNRGVYDRWGGDLFGWGQDAVGHEVWWASCGSACSNERALGKIKPICADYYWAYKEINITYNLTDTDITLRKSDYTPGPYLIGWAINGNSDYHIIVSEDTKTFRYDKEKCGSESCWQKFQRDNSEFNAISGIDPNEGEEIVLIIDQDAFEVLKTEEDNGNTVLYYLIKLGYLDPNVNPGEAMGSWTRLDSYKNLYKFIYWATLAGKEIKNNYNNFLDLMPFSRRYGVDKPICGGEGWELTEDYFGDQYVVKSGSNPSCFCKKEKLLLTYYETKWRDSAGSPTGLGNCYNGYCTDVYLLQDAQIYIDTEKKKSWEWMDGSVDYYKWKGKFVKLSADLVISGNYKPSGTYKYYYIQIPETGEPVIKYTPSGRKVYWRNKYVDDLIDTISFKIERTTECEENEWGDVFCYTSYDMYLRNNLGSERVCRGRDGAFIVNEKYPDPACIKKSLYDLLEEEFNKSYFLNRKVPEYTLRVPLNTSFLVGFEVRNEGEGEITFGYYFQIAKGNQLLQEKSSREPDNCFWVDENGNIGTGDVSLPADSKAYVFCKFDVLEEEGCYDLSFVVFLKLNGKYIDFDGDGLDFSKAGTPDLQDGFLFARVILNAGRIINETNVGAVNESLQLVTKFWRRIELDAKQFASGFRDEPFNSSSISFNKDPLSERFAYLFTDTGDITVTFSTNKKAVFLRVWRIDQDNEIEEIESILNINGINNTEIYLSEGNSWYIIDVVFAGSTAGKIYLNGMEIPQRFAGNCTWPHFNYGYCRYSKGEIGDTFKYQTGLDWNQSWRILDCVFQEYPDCMRIDYNPAIYHLEHRISALLWSAAYSPTSVPVKVYEAEIEGQKYIFSYLFAGCGDKICMPFRGERCYVRVCPECSPASISRQYGIDYYYRNYQDLYNKYCTQGNCYNIEYCYCPDYNEECDYRVRDIFGCVKIKGIGEEASAKCQCDWIRNVTLTKKDYCCPIDSQIAFSHKPGVFRYLSTEFLTLGRIGEGDYYTTRIYLENSNCGNITTGFYGFTAANLDILTDAYCELSPSKVLELFGDCLGSCNWWDIGCLLTNCWNELTSYAIDCSRIVLLPVLRSVPVGEIPGYVLSKVNITYFDPEDKDFKKLDWDTLASSYGDNIRKYREKSDQGKADIVDIGGEKYLLQDCTLKECTCVDGEPVNWEPEPIWWGIIPVGLRVHIEKYRCHVWECKGAHIIYSEVDVTPKEIGTFLFLSLEIVQRGEEPLAFSRTCGYRTGENETEYCSISLPEGCRINWGKDPSGEFVENIACGWRVSPPLGYPTA